jgi:nucleoside-diphosphate-sugar epimerase
VRIAIAGAHGKIAMQLTRRLVARGDAVTGLIRNQDHAADLREAGADPVVCDLESARLDDIAAAVGSADAVVFAAGAGPGSGAARKLAMDRDGAIKLLQATEAGAPKYVIVSSIGAESPPDDDDVFSVYLRAKAEADAAVAASDREWSIVRPGSLSDDPGTGLVRIGADPYHGRVPRADVAAALDALLHDPRANGRILYVNGGSDPLEQALEAALTAPV